MSVVLFPSLALLMFTTTTFCESLIESIKNFMIENGVEVFPVDFLVKHPKGKTYTASYSVACDFVNKGHWEYFFIKGGKLCLHINYRGEYGLSEYDCEIAALPPVYGQKGEVLERIMSIHTSDLVKLVQVCYDTIGSVYFKDYDSAMSDIDEINALEAEYEARRNEVA